MVLPPSAAYSRIDSQQVFAAAEEILRNRGDQPRQKQNRLIFFAADFDVISRLKDQARTYLAWKSIVDDIENDKLNLDLFQAKQAKRYRDGTEQTLQQLIRETYKWLICPFEEFVRGKPTLRWEAVSVSPVAQNLVQAIENKLREEDWLIYEWSPIHLRNILNQWYFKEGITEVGALKVWQDYCHYLYLPRLVNDQVFKNAIYQGVESEDFFGFASGKEGDKYLGFVFGGNANVMLDSSSLLIERETAAHYKERIKAASQPSTGLGEGPQAGYVQPSPGDKQPLPGGINTPVQVPTKQTVAVKKQFYSTISLDPVKAKMDFATIVDEVVQQFTSKLGVDVAISVEIQARSREGFDDALQRTVKENCNVLKFGNAEFEEE